MVACTRERQAAGRASDENTIDDDGVVVVDQKATKKHIITHKTRVATSSAGWLAAKTVSHEPFFCSYWSLVRSFGRLSRKWRIRQPSKVIIMSSRDAASSRVVDDADVLNSDRSTTICHKFLSEA